MFTRPCLIASISLLALACASPPVQYQPLYASRQLPVTQVTTPLGVAQGTAPTNGVSRFAVKYASAQRWENPVVADTWEIPYVLSGREVMTFTKFFLGDIEIIYRVRQRSRWRVLSLL